MWHLGTWYGGGFGSAGCMAGLGDLTGFSNLHDSVSVTLFNLTSSEYCNELV